MLVKLKSGSFQPQADAAGPSGSSSLERRALLVYAGEFESMNGPVAVTVEQLSRLVDNHNTLLSKFKRLAAGKNLTRCPPVQVDHSTSGWDTVGRLIGDLELGDHELEDGAKIPGIYGTVRILGKDNVERVEDGRWVNLSIGADFDKGVVSELTITPFPAAAEASLLKRPDEAPEPGSVKPEPEPTEELSAMDMTKAKAYLTGVKGMSDDDATAHLAALSAEAQTALSAEMDDHEAKLSAAAAEQAEKEKAEQAAKLTAARGKLTQLSSNFVAAFGGAQLAARKGKVIARLSKLRASARITPAEIKKLDIAQLAAADDKALDLVMKSYEDREPVILVGQLGTLKATDLSELSAKAKKQQDLAKLEAETRANMSLLSGNKAGAATTKLSTPAGADTVNIHVDTDPHTDQWLEKEYGEVCMMIDQGKGAEVKERLKSWMRRTAGAVAMSDHTESSSLETEQQLSALSEGLTKTQAEFDALRDLTTELVGA